MGPGPKRGGVLATLLHCEIRMLLRDTRVILVAVVVPLVIFPLLILVMRRVGEREERALDEATYAYAVRGDQAAWGRTILDRAIRGLAEPSGGGATRFVERVDGDADSLLEAGVVHVIVEVNSPASYQAQRDENAGDEGLEATSPAETETPVFALIFRARSDFSRRAVTRMREGIAEVRAEMRDSAYLARGLPVEPGRVAATVVENVASGTREGGALLGLLVTPFVLLLMLSGGSILAVDTISGEKERGTLETLLTTAATRTEIVAAKQLAIVVVGLAVVLVNLADLYLYFVLGILELPGSLAIALSMPDLALTLILLAPLTLLVSSALLLLSGFARSYKEYQIYFFPVFLLFLAPSVAGMLPGMDLRSAIAFVPVAGIGVAIREIMVGERDLPFLAVAFASSTAAGLWLSRLTARALSMERLIGGAEMDAADLLGGPALFPRHVLRWFALLWVAFLAVSLWFGQALGLRGQIVLNLVVLFLGGSVAMMRRYRLPVRETLSLRRPPARVWLAVLIGAPSGYVVGVGLAALVNAYLFPVPETVLEAFGDIMLGDELPLWELLFFLAILPAILEEITFRGLLLSGLRRRLGPVATCLAVGGIFGVFHVSLFRIVPTAYLGALLTAVVLLSGSIFPAMLWHALNNSIALVPAYLGWVGTETELPMWSYAAGVAGLLVAFGILWPPRISSRGSPR